MRSRDVVVGLNGLKIVKGPSVYYMMAMSGSASDHSLSLNFSLLSSLFKWLQVFLSSSSSAHALRSPCTPSQSTACYSSQACIRPLHSSYLQFSPRICALLLSDWSLAQYSSHLSSVDRAAVTAWDLVNNVFLAHLRGRAFHFRQYFS